MKKRQFSRRDFLTLLGLSVGGTVATGTCATISALLWRGRDNDPSPTPITLLVPEDTVSRPTMVSRDQWDASSVNHSATNERGFYSTTNPEGWRVYADALTDAYQTLVIHHSVIYGDNDLDTVRDIQRTHQQDRGWADVGYHYLVGRAGEIYIGRDLQARGTHVQGFNTGSVGVCLLGNFMEIAPTEAQINATLMLSMWLADHLALTHLAGHRTFSDGTVCPGDNLVPYLADFAQSTGLLQGKDGYIPLDETDEQACTCGCTPDAHPTHCESAISV